MRFAVGGESPVLPPSLDNEEAQLGLVVQFIHQKVKEYVFSSEGDLELFGVPSEILEDGRNWFLLRSCEPSLFEWVCCVRRDVYTYANRCEHAFDYLVNAMGRPEYILPALQWYGRLPGRGEVQRLLHVIAAAPIVSRTCDLFYP